MVNKIKPLGLSLSTLVIALSASVLSGCHSGDESLSNNGAAEIGLAPHRTGNVNAAVYAQIRSNAAANSIFNLADGVSTGSTGSEKCAVKIHKMTYKTIGGAGEETTSTGVFMLPQPHTGSTSTDCTGDLPVVLYAHGTWDERANDLSQFIADPTNGASQEAVLLLAMYASRGYAVIAPNYAGYGDSTLNYHPYVDEKQQSTEMIDALEHVRTHASTLGASFSDKLFVSGMSQGGYVAMATHKALQAKGETVTASAPMSGPYAMLGFLDEVMALPADGGRLNDFATAFAPLYLTALEKAHDIYTDPGEVYASDAAPVAENSLPRPGGFDDAGLPFNLFSDGAFPGGHLLSDSFRTAYNADKANNGNSPQNNIRKLTQDLDLRNWSPSAPVVMCGAASDTVVFQNNATNMMTYWGALAAAGLVQSIDLDALPIPAPGQSPQSALEALGGGWALWKATPADSNDPSSVPAASSYHGGTAPFCSKVAASTFDSML